MATPSSDAPAKIIVAIHGIGDQVGYETAQAVARQVGHYYDVATSIPLGRFYTGVGADKRAVPMPFLVTATDNPDLRQKTGFDVGFAEVYWASIPRVIVKDGHILEESKKWARTVATRLAQRAQSVGKPMPVREQIRLTTVLDEMIETVAIVERLNFVLAKAGVLQFNLNKLLTDFLGDVQIVVDFQSYRTQILDAFSEVMGQALKLGSKDQPRELYLIGHSEGSVITFLALLQALADQDAHPWIRSVRGVMTIGSPIEVHHLLWPGLWNELTPDSKRSAAALTIPWKNYYDFGDPIAYQLTATRDWMQKHRFDHLLELDEIDYAHSYLPGKAHVDYWSDNEVFAHFIDNVVCTPRPAGVMEAPKPKTKWLPVVVSYGVPKLLIAVLMCLAVYAIYRPVSSAVADMPVPATQVFGDVLGLGLLLLGVTAAARLPRLTSKWRWWLAAAVGLLVSLVAYEKIVALESRQVIGALFLETGRDPTRGVQGVAVIAAVLAGALASWFPSWGTRILPIIGLLAIIGLMGDLILDAPKKSDLWPVAVGAAIFFYLWRITALLFDLVFVWHRYVRHAAARDTIAEVCTDGYKGTKLETWTGVAANKTAAAPAGAK